MASFNPQSPSQSIPPTPRRTSGRVRFGSARKRDPNNIYAETWAEQATDDKATPPRPSSSHLGDAQAKRLVPEDHEYIYLDCDDSDAGDHDATTSRTPTKKRKVAENPERISAAHPSTSPMSKTSNPKPALKDPCPSRTTSGDEVLVDQRDEDGILEDVNDGITSEAKARKPAISLRTEDIRAFFFPQFIGDDKKTYRRCKECKNVSKKDFVLADYHTTLRRHCEIYHEYAYLKWCKTHSFISQLPKAKKAKALGDKSKAIQSSIDGFTVNKEVVIPYSDEVFRSAAIEWLVSTDQPLEALDHPKFYEMIHTAARAKNGVKIPGRNSARTEIIQLFNDHLNSLKTRLNSNAVPGLVSSTCDAWSASNVDNYFSVTVHWIEEVSPNVLELKSDLAGFYRLPQAHSGERLGQVMFKIFVRIKIEHKIGWISCDNAANNGSMMVEFSRCIRTKLAQDFDPGERRIRCLAHIINLATQALIKHRSPGSCYDIHDPEAHVPDTSIPRDGKPRDEVAIVRSVSVKAKSSGKRKEAWVTLQRKAGRKPRDIKLLKLDMPVRWSSTYTMLKRAYDMREFIPPFLKSLEREAEKARNFTDADKTHSLNLSSAEWEHIRLFLELLQIADDAQQAFSAELYPTLHDAIPAIEFLVREWTKCLSNPKYRNFHESIEHAVMKAKEYRGKMEVQEAYVVAMVLDPVTKFRYMQKNWTRAEALLAEEKMKTIFQLRFEKIAKSVAAASAPSMFQTPTHTHKRYSRRDMSDSEGEGDAAQLPWEREYHKYISSKDKPANGVSVIHWWGLQKATLPTWTSLAYDYLAIMASSVSSERAFSSAGLTITKRRNRLKGDLVEALQVLKFAIRGGLLVRPQGPTVEEEEEYSSDEDTSSLQKREAAQPPIAINISDDDEVDAEQDNGW